MAASFEFDHESVRSSNVAARLAEVIAVLRELGPGYERALRVGLRNGRFFSEQTFAQEQADELVDTIEILPRVASAAFRGCASSTDAHERVAAARGLPELSVMDPDLAKTLLSTLLNDGDSIVAGEAARSSELVWQIARVATHEATGTRGDPKYF